MRIPTLLLALVVTLSSCQGPGPNASPQPQSPVGDGGRVSWKRDALGHRPGPKGFRTVIIDAGHGGRDSGARSASTGVQEKRIALDTAHRLAAKLRGKFRTILIRDGDSFVDLDRRVQIADQSEGAILVSIHYNWSPSSSTRGPETYYWRVDSYALAKRFQREMERVIPGRSGNLGLRRRRLRLTRNPQIPCVLLELGYLSNPAEARLCATASHRDRLAGALAKAIHDQAKLGDAGMGPLPRPINKPPSRPSDPPGS